MKKPIEGLFQALNEIEAKAKYSIINSDKSNLNEVYNHNLKVWYYRKSDKRDPINEEIEPINFISKDPDSLKCSRSIKGIPLKESLFIEEELLLLSKLNRIALPLDEKILFDAYIKYLQQKDFTKPEIPILNPYPTIFKSEIGFSIFEQLHENYCEQKNHLANYSFLFYAMKDEFILCNGTDFIKFLSTNFQIDIDKIDSRQSGYNPKKGYYETIRKQEIANAR